MDFINLLASGITMPGGFWESIIGWLYSFIGDYGFAIIIISVIVKLLLSPLDFMQRKSTLKNTAVQQRLGPQIKKLQEKYGHDKQLLNQKQMELYKREGFGMFGACGVMLVYMVITLVVFISLFGAMNNITNKVTVQQYTALHEAYVNADDDKKTDAVMEAYKDNNISWLWVENIWLSDTIVSPVKSFDSYKKLDKDMKALEGEALTQAKTDYNAIITIVKDNVRSNNGFYILILLAAVVSFLSARVSMNKAKKKKAQEPEIDRGRMISAKGEYEKKQPSDQTAMMGKIMVWVLPIIMVIITLMYSAAFAIYIVTTSLFGLLSTLLFNKIIGDIDVDALKMKGKEQAKQTNRPEYSRPEIN